MSNEKETTQEQEKKNEQIIEMGEAILGEKRKDHVIYLLKDMIVFHPHQKRPSMSMFFRNLQRLKMITILTECFFC